MLDWLLHGSPLRLLVLVPVAAMLTFIGHVVAELVSRAAWRRVHPRVHTTVVLRGQPGAIIKLDDFRVRTSQGDVSIGSGTAIIPDSGALPIASLIERS